MMHVGTARGTASFRLGKIRAEYGDRWFDRVDHPEGRSVLGRTDFSFCIRVAGADAPANVHTGIPTSHAKGGIYLTEQDYLRQCERWTYNETACQTVV
jgi:hypothetical protein